MAARGGLWRNRDLTLVVAGSAVNGIGDWLLELALPIYVFLETGSGISTAAVYLVGLGARVLLGAYGGSLADRLPTRSTLVATNLLQIAALLPLLVVTPERVWPVYLVVLAQSLIATVNDPASFAVVPRLVDGDQLVSANSAMSASGSIARLIGAAAGGITISVGGLPLVVAADGATFAVGALAAGLLSGKADKAPKEPGEADADTSIRAGLSEVRSRPRLRALIGIQALAMLAFGLFPVLFIVFVADYLDGGGTEMGLLRSSSAFGGMAAAAVLGSWAKKFAPADVMTGGFLLFAVVGFLFVNAPSVTTALWVYLVLFAATGFPNVASQVGMTSTAQLLSPPEVLGRLGGLMGAAGALGMGIGSIGAGLLLEWFTARVLFNLQCFALLACAIGSFLFVRNRGSEPAQP